MLGLLAIGLLCAAPGAPPTPAQWVTDEAGLISLPVQERINRILENVERTTGHQVLVWVGESTDGEPIEQLSERAFAAWKVGRKGLDDGVVLFIFSHDRSARIEVGYGLEAMLPDAICARIIREQVAPAMARGQPDVAVTGAVESILSYLGAPSSDSPGAQVRRGGPTRLELLGFAILALGLLVLMVTRPALAMQLLAWIFLFRRGGRGGKTGGGFSGRGGRSGGGGASGNW